MEPRPIIPSVFPCNSQAMGSPMTPFWKLSRCAVTRLASISMQQIAASAVLMEFASATFQDIPRFNTFPCDVRLQLFQEGLVFVAAKQHRL